MRQPLEGGDVLIARSKARARFPARPLVVAAMNPCPCGFLGHPRERCRCSSMLIAKYRQKLSRPLLDRLDVHVRLPPVEIRTLTRGEPREGSAAIRARVVAAREIQLGRFRDGKTSRRTNSELSLDELKSVGALGKDCQRLIEAAATQLGLSARAFVKVLRVARTIADLQGVAMVGTMHVAEAIQGRILDRREG